MFIKRVTFSGDGFANAQANFAATLQLHGTSLREHICKAHWSYIFPNLSVELRRRQVYVLRSVCIAVISGHIVKEVSSTALIGPRGLIYRAERCSGTRYQAFHTLFKLPLNTVQVPFKAQWLRPLTCCSSSCPVFACTGHILLAAEYKNARVLVMLVHVPPLQGSLTVQNAPYTLRVLSRWDIPQT